VRTVGHERDHFPVRLPSPHGFRGGVAGLEGDTRAPGDLSSGRRSAIEQRDLNTAVLADLDQLRNARREPGRNAIMPRTRSSLQSPSK
jgi:hypothetical protein